MSAEVEAVPVDVPEDPRLARLRDIRTELQGIDAREVELYAERLALFRELRAEDPPVAQKVIGAAAGVTDTAVKVAMDKADRLEAEAKEKGT